MKRRLLAVFFHVFIYCLWFCSSLFYGIIFFMKYLAVLGRQPKISLAELFSLFSDVQFFGGNLALFESDGKPEISQLGGTIKLARPLNVSPEKYLLDLDFSGKYVIGVSDYSRGASAKKSQMLALKIKRVLKKEGKSIIGFTAGEPHFNTPDYRITYLIIIPIRHTTITATYVFSLELRFFRLLPSEPSSSCRFLFSSVIC